MKALLEGVQDFSVSGLCDVSTGSVPSAELSIASSDRAEYEDDFEDMVDDVERLEFVKWLLEIVMTSPDTLQQLDAMEPAYKGADKQFDQTALLMSIIKAIK